jgi:hypothetical protein
MSEQQDVFGELSAWRPVGTGLAQLHLSGAPAARHPALRLDYDFKGGAGFVVASRALHRPMPAEYVLRLRLRGKGPANHLELKLVDATGLNVWRHVIRDLRPPARWRSIEIHSRDIEFAWGPASGGLIAELSALEIAVVAGAGGSGNLWLADLEIEAAPAVAEPVLQASSALPGFAAGQALQPSGWKPLPDDARPWLQIDLQQRRVLGGVVIDWPDGAPAGGFRLRGSYEGRRWKTLYRAAVAGGRRSYVYAPGMRSRFLRLELSQPVCAILRLQPFEFSRSVHEFWHQLAQAEPRGWHPRWLLREQSLWTPFGTARGQPCALINEEGMVEPGEGSFSLEPMLWLEGRLHTWAEVTPEPALQDGWMPVPSVRWRTGGWCLCIQGEASVDGMVRVKYRIENLSGRPLQGRLLVLLRPFQVTPPWQAFRQLGGIAPMGELQWCDGAVLVNGTTRLVPMGPATFGAQSFDEGCIAACLATGHLPGRSLVQDVSGWASAVLAFELSLAPGAVAEHALALPSATEPLDAPPFDWGARIATGQWRGEGWAAEAVPALHTAAAQVLLTRAGAALQPGPRRYTRSWIRDSTLMSAALLRMGCTGEVRDFIRWYAPHQRADGFVPCCVDRDGPDWLVEHDSHGQLIALVADYHAFTGDEELLLELWPHIAKAVACIENLLEPEGLLPVSVSHEGYLAQPVHSYWDDFWALRGLQDAVHLAGVLGHEDQQKNWSVLAQRFSGAVFASIRDTCARRQLDFIPGSVEWADFDPTSTANAVSVLGVPEGLDRGLLNRTFDTHMQRWRQRRDGIVPAPNYTPYEIRVIGALVRLGRRDEALELLRFYLDDRRPRAWNQWPEIAWRDRRAPGHLGDLPHTWIAAEYILAVRSLFAYEREADRSLVLGAGLAPEWIEGEGVRVQGMATLYGPLSYTLRRLDAHTLRCDLGASPVPLVLRPPLPAALLGVTIDGSTAGFDADGVTVPPGAASVIFTSTP